MSSSAVEKAGTWINPMHGTEASRKALRAAAHAVEESAFKRAKPRLNPRYPGAGTSVGKRQVEVAKGRLGVKPVLARVNPTATMRPRKPVLPSRSVIGKYDDRDPTRYEPIIRRLTPEERASHRRSNTVAGGILGGATGASLGIAAGELHMPPRNHGRYALLGGAAGAGLGALAGHHAPGPDYVADLAPERRKKGKKKVHKADEVAKFNPMSALKAVRRAKPIDMAVGGFRQGAKGLAKPKVGLHTATALPSSKPLQHIGSAAKWTGENRTAVGIGSGIVGGSVVGAGLAHHSDRQMLAKAYGDPEDARYARLGAGATLLGGAGAAGTALGVRQIHRDTKRERKVRSGLGHDIDPGPKPAEYKPGQHTQGGPTHRDWMRYQKLMAEKKKLEAVRGKPLKGIVLRGRSGAMLGGGLAALAGAEGLRRKATDRRWN